MLNNIYFTRNSKTALLHYMKHPGGLLDSNLLAMPAQLITEVNKETILTTVVSRLILLTVFNFHCSVKKKIQQCENEMMSSLQLVTE